MAESDKDRPQITLSSNSDELISPLDIRSIGPLATPPRPLNPDQRAGFSERAELRRRS